jgi:hypothetical protein
MQETEHQRRDDQRDPTARHFLDRSKKHAAKDQFLEDSGFHPQCDCGDQVRPGVQALDAIDTEHDQDQSASRVEPGP